MKKPLSILLALALIVGVVAVGTIGASAASLEDMRGIPIWMAVILYFPMMGLGLLLILLTLSIPIIGPAFLMVPMVLMLPGWLPMMAVEWFLQLFGYSFILTFGTIMEWIFDIIAKIFF